MSWELIAAAAVVLVLMMRRSSPPPDLQQLAADAADRAGVDRALFFAIIEVESNWNPDAKNLGPADAARGGAWGLTQLTLRTARAYAPGIEGEQLLDPARNLDIASQLMRDNARRSKRWDDLAAMWNSGKVADRAPDSTRYKYIPAVLAAAQRYRAQGIS